MLVPIGHTKLGWEVASWLVTHSTKYGIHQVRFGGYQWRAAAGSQGLGTGRGRTASGHHPAELIACGRLVKLAAPGAAAAAFATYLPRAGILGGPRPTGIMPEEEFRRDVHHCAALC